jgi:rRNA maturation endonuclease Nob1
MKIDRKVAKGYEIRCDCSRAFVTGRLGPSVECPYCGHTALSADLAAEFHARVAEDREAERIAAA